jgi:CRP/FNR family transcriptional regulator, cyclic AMP receptor protein
MSPSGTGGREKLHLIADGRGPETKMSVQVAHNEMVAVLEEDPDLAQGLPPAARESARAVALAPLLALEPGSQRGRFSEPPPRAHLGYLVLDGLIMVHVWFGSISSTEFLGPSDVLRPWPTSTRVQVAEASWETLTPTRLAVLDRDFATRVRAWPELTAALFDRYTERVASQLMQSALRKSRRVEDRIWVALWHFASRWGRVSGEGHVVDLPKVTGETLANIVGARRQSVSTALSALTEQGAIRRRPDGSWVITKKPPQLGLLTVPQLVR